MDNHFVPNLTMGPMILSALRKHGITQPIDVHLMVSPVERMVEDFASAGATCITFHPEACTHVDRTLEMIRSLGCKSGLVFNPATPLDVCEYVMDKLDIILLMSVNPGFGGQAFIPSSLVKAKQARNMITKSGRGQDPTVSFSFLKQKNTLARSFHTYFPSFFLSFSCFHFSIFSFL
jgi:ribulose-phosphate 3-epimerase